MYNRYIPEGTSYVPVDHGSIEPPQRIADQAPPVQHRPPPTRSQHQTTSGGPGRAGAAGQAGQSAFQLGGFKIPSFLTGKDALSTLFSGKEGRSVSGLLKGLKLGDFDSGDILLLLIILFLLAEGDDLELVIALGLVLIMGLGADNKDKGEGVT